MASRVVGVNPELVLRDLAHLAVLKQCQPGSPGDAIRWALGEIDRLRAVELAAAELAEQLAAANVENARLHVILVSRTPDHRQWEHAAQVLHGWTCDTGWRGSPEPLRQRSRMRVSQIGVELGLIDV